MLSYPGGADASLGGEVSRLLGPGCRHRLGLLAALLLVGAGTLAALHPRAAPGHRATNSRRRPSHRRVSYIVVLLCRSLTYTYTHLTFFFLLIDKKQAYRLLLRMCLRAKFSLRFMKSLTIDI